MILDRLEAIVYNHDEPIRYAGQVDDKRYANHSETVTRIDSHKNCY